MKILSLSAALFLMLLVLFSVHPQILTLYDPALQQANSILLTPDKHFWAGTDELGRDMLARLLYGARVSLACGFFVTVISLGLGVLIGILAASAGGSIDKGLMRLIDILASIPDLLLYIFLGFFMGHGFWGIILALTSLGWISTARLTRNEMIKLKQAPFIEAAKACGGLTTRIYFYHLLPHLKGPLKTLMLIKIPQVILAESTLSFVGLGIKAPLSSWGSLAYDGYGALPHYPHLIAGPSLLLITTLLAFQILAQNKKE